MKIATIIFFILLVVAVQITAAQEGEGGPKKMKNASESGMQYGAIMVGLIIMVVLPTAAMLLITKMLGIGVEEVSIVKCLYTSIIFFAIVGVVFYYFTGGLEKGLNDPVEFFRDTNLLIGLGIGVVSAFLLLHFVLAGTLLRSLGGSILYVIAFYGCTFLAYKIVAGAGAEKLLQKGISG